jgi:hypothetical protein
VSQYLDCVLILADNNGIGEMVSKGGALKCCRKRAFSAMIRVWTKNIEERLYNEF